MYETKQTTKELPYNSVAVEKAIFHPHDSKWIGGLCDCLHRDAFVRKIIFFCVTDVK